MALTYARYLKTQALLALQEPRSAGPEHDELLFIVVHQVYELWFKLLLHELDEWCVRMQAKPISDANRTMDRCLRVLALMIDQIELLETSTPLAFARFRDTLERASGFQSTQFRELEALLGDHKAQTMSHVDPLSPEGQKIQARREAPSVWVRFVAYAKGQGFALATHGEDESQDAELLRLYREHPEAAAIAERLVDLDAKIQRWRYRHIQLVLRTIGSKPGTGGSPGTSYLQGTLSKFAFPALWRVRAMM